MGIATREDIDLLTKELCGKYAGFLKEIKVEHYFQTDMVHIYIVFHPEDKTDGTWLAADYVKVAGEVAENMLGVSLKTLKQLGTVPELTSTVLGRCIHFQVDATTRHILLNGMDDPFDRKLALMDEMAKMAKAPYYGPLPTTTPTIVPALGTIGSPSWGSGLGGAIGTGGIGGSSGTWNINYLGGDTGGSGGYSEVVVKSPGDKTWVVVVPPEE